MKLNYIYFETEKCSLVLKQKQYFIIVLPVNFMVVANLLQGMD